MWCCPPAGGGGGAGLTVGGCEFLSHRSGTSQPLPPTSSLPLPICWERPQACPRAAHEAWTTAMALLSWGLCPEPSGHWGVSGVTISSHTSVAWPGSQLLCTVVSLSAACHGQESVSWVPALVVPCGAVTGQLRAGTVPAARVALLPVGCVRALLRLAAVRWHLPPWPGTVQMWCRGGPGTVVG